MIYRSLSPDRRPPRVSPLTAYSPAPVGAVLMSGTESVPGQQAPQQLPELPEPARRHMREPRREEPADSGAAAHPANHVIVGKAVLQHPWHEPIDINRIRQVPRRLVS
jgi:hypothetical protein